MNVKRNYVNLLKQKIVTGYLGEGLVILEFVCHCLKLYQVILYAFPLLSIPYPHGKNCMYVFVNQRMGL